MNLKKIWDGLREKKVAPVVKVIATETHMVYYAPELPDAVISLEKEAEGFCGRQFKGAPVTYVAFRVEKKLFVFHGDLRAELLPIISDVKKLHEFCDSNIDRLTPSSYVVHTFEKDHESDDKPTIGFRAAA